MLAIKEAVQKFFSQIKIIKASTAFDKLRLTFFCLKSNNQEIVIQSLSKNRQFLDY